MADANSVRQKITDKIKDASNILVTVGRDPGVDELSAALGLTLMLTKLDKHATAVVSGTIPPALAFLEPSQTFTDNVNGLRDFIIALDKEKADHLRYKVDGDVVKIFITPYRTEIDEKDLEFTLGDYNVELVLAVGVRDETQLDEALSAHGKILHDATVAVIDTDGTKASFGGLVWQDSEASSICEMLVGLSGAMKSSKPLLDEQISTALLTGIVAATDRFSNERTTSNAMTMAAQLMAAGANQQLIATNLEEAHEISDAAPQAIEPADSSATQEPPQQDDDVGSLSIAHEPTGDLDEVTRQVNDKNGAAAVAETQKQLSEAETAQQQAAEDLLAAQLSTVARNPLPDVPAIGSQTTAISEAHVDSAVGMQDALEAPMMGGTLNATSAQAAKDSALAAELDAHKMVLSHDFGSHDFIETPQAPPAAQGVMNANMLGDDETSVPDPTAAGPVGYQQPDTNQGMPTLAEIDEANRGTQPAPVLQPLDQTMTAAPVGLPPLPDFSTLPPPVDAPQGSPLPPLSAAPPVVQAGAVPADQLHHVLGAPVDNFTPEAPQPNDPNQFQIPGQS